MRKKVLFVDNSTWNIYNFRLNLIKRLKSEGYEVVVVAPVDEYIHYLNESYFTKHIPLKFLAPQSKNIFRDLLLIIELYRIFRQEKPDLILNYTIKPNIFGNFAAKLARAATVSVITGLGYTFLNKNLLTRQIPFLYKLAFRHAKKVIVYNKEDLKLLIKEKIIPSHKGKVIFGEGLNTNHYRPLPKPNSEKFIFLFIGRLLYDKGLGEYVEAAKKIREISRNIECWVIGELHSNPAAISKNTLVQWIENKHIKYIGTTQDVRKYVKQVDCLVLPSYREGMPRVVLEAMAMAKPIITTDVAGCNEAIDHETNGYIIPAKNNDELAQNMLKMYTHSDLEINEFGINSRKRVLRLFDEKIITPKYIDLVNTILKTKTKKPQLTSRYYSNKSKVNTN